MERLTHEADFGFEDWEETLFSVKSDPDGAYNILDIAKYQGEEEFDQVLINIALRLAAIENILGDDYDLDRLKVIVNQRMTMREEVAERFRITKDFPVERISELVEADRDGRCVVLPFRPPKTVYSCSKRFPIPKKTHYASAINVLWDMDRGYVFGDTPEAAEAALKGEQDG